MEPEKYIAITAQFSINSCVKQCFTAKIKMTPEKKGKKNCKHYHFK